MGHVSVGDRVTVDVDRNQMSINIDPYSCVIKNNGNVVGHIPREISRHVWIGRMTCIVQNIPTISHPRRRFGDTTFVNLFYQNIFYVPKNEGVCHEIVQL